jgi:uncharacterized protein YhfF
MREEKLNADDVEEIIAEQLRKLTAKTVDDHDVYVADAVANQIGKGLKHAAVRMKYAEMKNTENGKAMGTIAMLEPRK